MIFFHLYEGILVSGMLDYPSYSDLLYLNQIVSFLLLYFRLNVKLFVSRYTYFSICVCAFVLFELFSIWFVFPTIPILLVSIIVGRFLLALQYSPIFLFSALLFIKLPSFTSTSQIVLVSCSQLVYRQLAVSTNSFSNAFIEV